MESVVSKIVERFLAKKIITEVDKEIYAFGLKQSAVLMINFTIILVIGLISGELSNLTIFSVAYLALRPYAGGYHSETEWGCLFLSTMMMILVVVILKFTSLSMGVYALALGASSGILFVLSPLEDHRKPLDDGEVKFYRKRLRKLLSFELILIAIGMVVSNDLIRIIGLAIVTIGFMVLVGWIVKKYKNCVEKGA